MPVVRPLFSIVIPTYNCAHLLTRALDSVCNQTDSACEVVVVDDGSTDATAEVVQSYGQKIRNLIYRYQVNRGPGAARNHGTNLAKGSYLLFLDSDDQLLPDALMHFHRAFLTGDKFDFVFGGHVRIRPGGRVKATSLKPLSERREDNVRRYLFNDLRAIAVGGAVIRKDVFARIRFPEEIRNMEDVVFFSRLLGSHDGMILSEIVVALFRHQDSLSHNPRYAAEDPLKAVDLIFDPIFLPAGVMHLRNKYHSLICLAQGRLLYKLGKYPEAKLRFEEAFRIFPGHLWRISHLRRYLWLVLRPATSVKS